MAGLVDAPAHFRFAERDTQRDAMDAWTRDAVTALAADLSLRSGPDWVLPGTAVGLGLGAAYCFAAGTAVAVRDSAAHCSRASASSLPVWNRSAGSFASPLTRRRR